LTPAFAFLGAAATVLYVASKLFPWSFDVERLISLEVAISLVYAALSALFSFWRIPITLPSARVAVLIAGVSMIVYPLVSLADIFGFSYPGMIAGIPIWMQTQPEYYAVVVPILMVFVVRQLINRESAPSQVNLDAFGLTDREKETVSRLLRGETYKSISFALGVSVATVKTHVNKAYAKLGVRSRAELQAGRARTPSDSRRSAPRGATL
jgi:DNA-binding CsgD family transcriptional regulator